MVDTTDAAPAMREFAATWHGGQGSPLYAYSSSGTILMPFVAREIRQCQQELLAGQFTPEEIAVEEIQLSALLTHLTTLCPEDSDDQ